MILNVVDNLGARLYCVDIGAVDGFAAKDGIYAPAYGAGVLVVKDNLNVSLLGVREHFFPLRHFASENAADVFHRDTGVAVGLVDNQ